MVDLTFEKEEKAVEEMDKGKLINTLRQLILQRIQDPSRASCINNNLIMKCLRRNFI